MKISIECRSPLLQKSLELFLAKYLCSSSECEIIIRDEECFGDSKCFFIASSENADLQKPFSKIQLLSALKERYQLLPKERKETFDFRVLEKRIESLTQEYQQNIMKAVKTFYEK